MNNEISKPDSNLKSAIEAATGLLKAIPIYEDVIQPSAQQVGKSLETITRTVNIALAPIKALVWGYDQIEQFIITRVAEKLRNVPPENITTPVANIAGPSVEALRYSGNDFELRELFANLLATAMDSATLHRAHPGYVEIIKNISSDEARLLKAFIDSDIYPIIDARIEEIENPNGSKSLYSRYSHLYKNTNIKRVDLLPSYLDNLSRLGILESPQYLALVAENTYEPLEDDKIWDKAKETVKAKNEKVVFSRGVVRLTTYGKQFIENVVKEKP